MYSKYFLRLQVEDAVGVFAEITSIFSKNGVSFEKILQLPVKEKGMAEIVLITHHASLLNYENILIQLRDLSSVRTVKSSYRVEGGTK
jgi:homoserine dehydrogenase